MQLYVHSGLARKKAGFSLIELSIVLVIIGLLAGGIVAGQSLVRTAALNSIGKDYQSYITAHNQFRDEFRAVAGDMRTATDYWGSADSTGFTAACYNAIKTGETTCNGNGDTNIDNYNWALGYSDGAEAYLYWQHLSNAGTIQGRFTGRGTVGGNGGYGTMNAINTPSSRISATFKPQAIAAYVDDATWYAGTYKNVYIVGADNPASGGSYGLPLISPGEALNIDRKYDDAAPGTGQIRSFKNLTECAVDSANYKITVNTNSCILIMAIEPIV